MAAEVGTFEYLAALNYMSNPLWVHLLEEDDTNNGREVQDYSQAHESAR